MDSGAKELQGKVAVEQQGCGDKRAAGWQSWAIGQLGNRVAIMDSGTTWVTGQQGDVIRAAVMGDTAAAMDDRAAGLQPWTIELQLWAVQLQLWVTGQQGSGVAAMCTSVAAMGHRASGQQVRSHGQ